MGEDSSPRCLVAPDSTFLRWETSQRATRRLSRIWGKDSSPRCPVSPLAPHRARLCAPLFGLVRRLPPAAVQRGRAQLALCVSRSPVQIGALSVSLAAWSLFAGTWCSGKVSPRGEARCSGASGSRILPENHSISASSDRMILLQSRPRPAYAARKVGSPPVGTGRAPFGESFDLRRLRPNDSPPVVWRPGLRRLALFRSALRAPVICSPASCVGQESRLLKPACRSAQTPSGVFLFPGRFAPASQRVAAFRPPLWLNLICPAQAPDKSDSAAASGFSFPFLTI